MLDREAAQPASAVGRPAQGLHGDVLAHRGVEVEQQPGQGGEDRVVQWFAGHAEFDGEVVGRHRAGVQRRRLAFAAQVQTGPDHGGLPVVGERDGAPPAVAEGRHRWTPAQQAGFRGRLGVVRRRAADHRLDEGPPGQSGVAADQGGPRGPGVLRGAVVDQRQSGQQLHLDAERVRDVLRGGQQVLVVAGGQPDLGTDRRGEGGEQGAQVVRGDVRGVRRSGDADDDQGVGGVHRRRVAEVSRSRRAGAGRPDQHAGGYLLHHAAGRGGARQPSDGLLPGGRRMAVAARFGIAPGGEQPPAAWGGGVVRGEQ